jgi:hypothetical protein
VRAARIQSGVPFGSFSQAAYRPPFYALFAFAVVLFSGFGSVFPLEGMDLMVNPIDQKLAGVHGDKAVYLVM